MQLPIAAMTVTGFAPPVDPLARPQANDNATPRRDLQDSGRGAWSGQAAPRGTLAQQSPVIAVLPSSRQLPERPPALPSPGFAPFLAQQIAQDSSSPRDVGDNGLQIGRGIAAYRLAAGDQSTLLGPVRPTDLRI